MILEGGRYENKEIGFFSISHCDEIKQKQKWISPGDGIELALGTNETISVKLEALSEENCSNLEANKCNLSFTEIKADTRCPACLYLCASNFPSGKLYCYPSQHSQDLSNRNLHVLSTQRNTIMNTKERT